MDNVVPLLVYHRGLEPQEAVYQACLIINDSYTIFESLVPSVLDITSKKGLAEGPAFVTCCKNFYIGAVNWLYGFSPSDRTVSDLSLTNHGRYNSKRYHDFRPEDGETEALIPMW